MTDQADADVSADTKAARVVVWRDSTGGWAIEIVGLAEVARMIGEETFAALVRCFMGADRLRAFRHFYQLNDAHVPKRSSSYLGNWLVVLLSAAGTAHEMGDAIRAVLRAKVVVESVGQEVREPLDQIRKRWQTHPVLSKIRNQLGFHLGDLELYVKGVADLAASKQRAFLVGGEDVTRPRTTTMYRLPWDVLLGGQEIAPEADMLRVLRSVVEDSARFEGHLQSVFAELLKKVGVPVERRSTAVAPFVGLEQVEIDSAGAQDGGLQRG